MASAAGAATRPAVSLVIPTYNRPETLRRLLSAVGRSEPPVGGLEVIVVDDGSAHDTAEIAGSFGARHIRQQNAGPAAARERGWRAAAGESIVFLDDDCVPAPDAIRRLADALETVDGVGARVLPLSGDDIVSEFVHLEGLVGHGLAGDGRIRWLVTAAVAFRRSALEHVGGFDLGFRAAGEDVDLTLRLLEAGHHLRLEPAAVVYHDHCKGLGNLSKIYFRRGRAAPRLSLKHAIYRTDTMRSVGGYLVPREWARQYRGYRLGASRGRSLGFLALRAALTLPYATGIAMGQPRQRPGTACANSSPRPARRRSISSLTSELGRLLDSVVIFRNWPAVLRDIVLQRLGWSQRDMLAITRRGTRIHCRNQGLSRAPIYQVFADDDYGLVDYAAVHQGEQLTVIDIGAHVGSFALAVCELLPGASVTSYEPSPTSVEYLRRNVEANGLSERVRTIAKAVGGGSEPVVLYEASDASCVSSTTAWLAPAGAVQRTVESVSFDDVIGPSQDDIDLLKVDCEGAEYEIVRGGSPSSWRRVRRLVIEHHAVPGESWSELRRSLADLGFRVLKERPDGTASGLVILERRDPLLEGSQ
ncbi:MAG: FkbM family methyltransferase [Candidatus Dormibacteraeota bacterium]|uniref:FkbM family methyltransferase n=1 Tax=Candidatus Amunia macphersoniae TaxID=3127014 RepID=A0A934KD90_9BACT|nr:FkbM family methyltransferase [Candidatus Dormibacteraeota bacterium]